MQGDLLWTALSREPEIERPDEVDVSALWGQYFRRQRLLGEILTGTMHPDDLLDCMLDDGLSPDDYLNEVEQDLHGLVG